MKRLLLIPAAAVLAVAAQAAPASAASDFRLTPVTVADPNTAPSGQPELLRVTVGHHPTYDRVVFHFSSRTPGYSVRYVSAVTADPSGQRVRLAGNAFLAVTMQSVASAQAGKPAAPQGRQHPRVPVLREVAGAGDFEGHVSFGLGLSGKTGFRAFTLSNPDRLVVDVRMPATSGSSAAPAAGGQLANTGSDTATIVRGALMLLIVGCAARLASSARPRRARQVRR